MGESAIYFPRLCGYSEALGPSICGFPMHTHYSILSHMATAHKGVSCDSGCGVFQSGACAVGSNGPA
jgi:hypothetical protein